MTVQTEMAPGPEIWVRGPTVQLPAVGRISDEGSQRTTPIPVLPRRPLAPARPGLPAYPASCVGAHGGAGTTMVANALGAQDIGCRWPAVERGESSEVLLVARTHATGLQAAGRLLSAVKENPRSDIRVLALVLVADAPARLPRQLSQRIRVLRSAVRVHEIPWIPEWRVGDQPQNPPKALTSLAGLLKSGPRHARSTR